MKLRTVQQAKVKNKRVLLRAEFNVPLKSGRISDDKRIKESLPTIRYILKNKPKQLIILSHLGRPKAKKSKKYSLKPVAKRLEKLLKRKVLFFDKNIKKTKKLPDDKIILIENLRFYAGEKKDSKPFARHLSSFGDLYVNDAFGACHRKHASVHAITGYLKSYAGNLIQKEVRALSKLFNPKRPYVAIIGGGKADKIELIKKLTKKADTVLVGGASANVLIYCTGNSLGKTPLSKEYAAKAKQLVASNKVLFPSDVRVASSPASKNITVKSVNHIPKNKMIVDIGPESLNEFKEIIAKARTIFWGGPVSYIEHKDSRKGSIDLARAIANSKAYTIIGGGDSAVVAKAARIESKINHISTGGGASLMFIERGDLPCLKKLEK